MEEGKKACATILAILVDFGNDDHYEQSPQGKACEKTIARSRKWDGKISNARIEENKSYGQHLFDVADEIEERQSVFGDSRSIPALIKLILNIAGPVRRTIIAGLTQETVSNMLSRELQNLSEMAMSKKDATDTIFLSLLSDDCDLWKPDGMGLHSMKSSIPLVRQTQKKIHCTTTWRKFCRRKTPTRFPWLWAFSRTGSRIFPMQPS